MTAATHEESPSIIEQTNESIEPPAQTNTKKSKKRRNILRGGDQDVKRPWKQTANMNEKTGGATIQ